MIMEMLVLILGLSMVMWYIIDRFKPTWSNLSYGSYITMGISAIFAFALAFGFNLDIIYGLGLYGAATPLGTAITGFTLMSGSSAVSEVIGKVKAGASVTTSVTNGTITTIAEGDAEIKE